MKRTTVRASTAAWLLGSLLVEIKPHMGALNSIKCTVPSIKGEIVLEIRKTAGQINMRVVIPADTTAEVYLPLADNVPPDSP